MLSVLDLLKCSDCGLTQEQLQEKAKDNEIEKPFQQVGKLIAEGLVRFDETPAPGRFKATPQAFV